jgi:branched-chain amino acid transport system permease protein
LSTTTLSGKRALGSQLKWLGLAALVAALVSVPFWASEYVILLLYLIFLYMAMGQMWNLLGGFTGLVSLGQQIFIGLGAYTLAVMTEVYRLPVWPSVLVGGIISVLFGVASSVVLFRMRGVYFTIATWILAESLAVFFSNWEYVRMGTGFFIRAGYGTTGVAIYYPALLLALGSIALVYFLLRSKLGLGLMAMRDDEGAAESMGVEVFRSKLYCFLIAAFMTGITGAVYYLAQIFVQPYAAFSINWTVALVFIVVIGGIGTIEGPIVGAIMYVLLQQFLSSYVGISMIILGAVAIAIILVAPQGIVGTIQKRTGFTLLSTRRE